MSKMKRLVSLLVVIVIVFAASPVNAIASEIKKIDMQEVVKYSTISHLLNDLNDDELITVGIWLNDINYDTIKNDVVDLIGYGKEYLAQRSEKIISDYIRQKSRSSITNIFGFDFTSVGELSEYLSQTQSLRQELIQQTDSYIMAMREHAAEAYETYLTEFVNGCLTESSVIYKSKYAPLIICRLNRTAIEAISRYSQVVSIELCNDIECEDAGDINISLPTISANTVKSQGFDGTGLKIGQIETGVPDTERMGLYNAAVVSRSGNISSTDHASLVANILVGEDGIVPYATLYSTSAKYNASTGSVGTYTSNVEMENIEWLISQGVTVINRSFGGASSDGDYDVFSKWIDHVVNQHNITFVQAAGNNGAGSYKHLYAKNAILVGGMNDNGTIDASDDTYYYATSHRDKDIRKVDVVAPAVGFSIEGSAGASGTSFAAPHVAGVVAQMMCAVPGMKLKPEAIKAAVIASCTRKTISTDPQNVLSDKEGAGVINALNAVNSLSRISLQSTCYSNSGSAISFTFYPLTTGTKTISVVWLSGVIATGTEHTSLETPTLSSYKLEVRDPYGNLVTNGTLISENGESAVYLKFEATSTAAYTVTVTRTSSNTDATDRIAIANHR